MRNWLNQLRYKVVRFMYGRNGQDQLVMFSYFAGMLLYVCGAITRNTFVMSVAIALFFFGMFRCYSKNITKRRQENLAFCKTMRKCRNYFTLIKLRLKNRKTCRYYMCRECGQIVRVPETGKKIMITCPNCKNKFVKKS